MLLLFSMSFSLPFGLMKTPVNVAITGAAGQIGYALAFRVASGALLGRTSPSTCTCSRSRRRCRMLQGVVMELNDCAFPTLNKIVATDDARVAFKDSARGAAGRRAAARPRHGAQGPAARERADLLGPGQGDERRREPQCARAGRRQSGEHEFADRDANAPDLNPRKCFTAMTRLDHNRALSQLAEKTGAHTNDIQRMIIWGNHSATQYPDLSHCLGLGKAAKSLVDQAWIETTSSRPCSSAAPRSSRRAAPRRPHRPLGRDRPRARLGEGHAMGDWVSMGIPSDGSYGIPEGVIYSYPVTTRAASTEIVQGLASTSSAASAWTRHMPSCSRSATA
jgi:malate dehydrogenase